MSQKFIAMAVGGMALVFAAAPLGGRLEEAT